MTKAALPDNVQAQLSADLNHYNEFCKSQRLSPSEEVQIELRMLLVLRTIRKSRLGLSPKLQGAYMDRIALQASLIANEVKALLEALGA